MTKDPTRVTYVPVSHEHVTIDETPAPPATKDKAAKPAETAPNQGA